MTSTNAALQLLAGLPLSIARAAVGTRVFHFGPIHSSRSGTGTAGDYALHVDCPWRFVDPDGVITGSSDRDLPPRDGAEVDHNDPRNGSLQNVRLAALLGGYDEVTKSHINTTGGLVVVSVSADRYGGADIAFSDGIHLQLFPDGSVDENWRLFKPGDDSSHFVIEGGRIVSE